MADKYQAVWLSHSSIGDFLKCPRLYFLKNVYKDPKTGHKIKLMTPPLALGQAVHEVLESLSTIATTDRFKEPLFDKFDRSWAKVSGLSGGFTSPETENHYKERGRQMIARVARVKGPLAGKAVKIKEDLPQFWLSQEDNLILCGKIDWLQYLSDDSVGIIDFKTSRREEDPESLQLPIYHLLVHHCQHHRVSRAGYWYLELSDTLDELQLPDLDESRQKLIKIGKQIKLVRQLQHFKCPDNGCPYCRPYEAVLAGECQFVGTDSMKYDVYINKTMSLDLKESSVIL